MEVKYSIGNLSPACFMAAVINSWALLSNKVEDVKVLVCATSEDTGILSVDIVI